jgi:hypothetical protein
MGEHSIFGGVKFVKKYYCTYFEYEYITKNKQRIIDW